MSAPSQANIDTLKFYTKSIAFESVSSMFFNEHYLAPRRRAFNIMRRKYLGIDINAALQMATKAVNDSIDPGELILGFSYLAVYITLFF